MIVHNILTDPQKRLLIILSLLFSSQLLQAQTKRALVIGIGQYPEYTAWSKINGDKDLDSVFVMLRRAGFENRNITKLVNNQATKANIVSAFRKLTNECVKGDVVYIHFSGHGQQMTDLNGDESDELDECWIPYDACKRSCPQDRGEKHLIDDEIGKLLESVYAKTGDTGKILVVIDACHSGSGTRSIDDDAIVRGDTVVFCRGDQSKFVKRDNTSKVPAIAKPSAMWIVISACEDKQKNIEMRSPRIGRLTYALCKIAEGRGVMTNRQLSVQIQRTYDKNRMEKDPDQNVVIGGNMQLFNIVDVIRK